MVIFFTNHRLDIKLGRITSHLVHLPPFCNQIRLRQLFRKPPFLFRAPFPGDIEVPAITPDIDDPMGNKYVEDDSEMMADFEALVETSAAGIAESTRDQGNPRGRRPPFPVNGGGVPVAPVACLTSAGATGTGGLRGRGLTGGLALQGLRTYGESKITQQGSP